MGSCGVCGNPRASQEGKGFPDRGMACAKTWAGEHRAHSTQVWRLEGEAGRDPRTYRMDLAWTGSR